jgi:RNA polymerase sigma factor (sigma-70 family)
MSDAEGKLRLAAWFQQWRQPLRAFLRNRGTVPSGDVDDVAQEVFLRLLRYDRSLLVEYPQAYLYKIAANVAAEWSLRARVSRPHSAEWLDGLLADDRPDDDAARRQGQEAIERALNTLTGRQRAVLKLQFFEGLSHEEIAKRLNMTPRVVRRMVVQSYPQLRVQLNAEITGALAHGRE